MTLTTRLLRLFVGIMLMAGLLSGLFMLTLPAIQRWGATDVDRSTMNWIWLWQIEPLANGKQTRLLVRMGIDIPGPSDSVMGFMMDIGGFVMEQNMLQGIKLRAEGGAEPGWTEPMEIALWLTALLAGLVGAILFLLRPAWVMPVLVAVSTVAALFVLTFVQPALWLRAVIDGALLIWMILAWRAAVAKSPIQREMHRLTVPQSAGTRE